MSEGSYIYVIGCPTSASGPVKIGWTARDPGARLIDLRGDGTLTPANVDRASLQVLYSCVGDRTLERALHFRFRQLRVMGEWFSLNPAVAPREVRMAVAEIRPAAPSPATVAPDPHPTTPAASAAPRDYQLFTGWVRAGFTEDQALKMVALLAGR